jgi:hypothetical protein
MPTPREYFTNSREADLADRVWQLSAALPGSWKLNFVHEAIYNAYWPWVNKRIVCARDWITTKRESDGVGGVKALNGVFGTDFTAEEIGDVEHFYVAALIGTLGGPAGGVMLNFLGDTIWEMYVGPLRVAWNLNWSRKGLNRGARVVAQNLLYNSEQLTGPDWAGTRFGSFFAVNELIESIHR